ncbi:hypothetical protein Ccrd_021555 [Cynara cardunculus var. scolymus]|uniref:Uncharacterized protein n=1 Tax=Cynara cardunculus var. scolymus TaxID=59895 RepID=A0A103Y0C5_CYNCS|nr:hypothetical protein Ccrd_021555 [Cynara cardunculus var. scolymus]
MTAAPKLLAGLIPVPVIGMVAKNMGVSCTPLGIGSREDGVNQDEGADNLSTESGSFVVTVGQRVGTTAVPVVV